jgi:curved DNA-binding protein CbpA
MLLAAASAGQEENAGHKKHASNKRTHYEILGARPTADTRELRQKYTQLARELHPDAMLTKNSTTKPLDIEFYQIAEAWRVLGDVKERRRYDRELSRVEFADNFEVFLDQGIRNAVPFFKQTAKRTRTAVEFSSSALSDAGKRMEKASKVFELEQKSRQLEQQASTSETRVKELQRQLNDLQSTKLSVLSDESIDLTYSEAIRVLDSFEKETIALSIQEGKHDKTLRIEIPALAKVESEYTSSEQVCKEKERALSTAERKQAEALVSELRAQDRLEEAKRALKEAEQLVVEGKDLVKKTTLEVQTTVGELQKVKKTVAVKRQRVRQTLKCKEEEIVKAKELYLQKEKERLTENAKKLKMAAAQIKDEARAVQSRKEA